VSKIENKKAILDQFLNLEVDNIVENNNPTFRKDSKTVFSNEEFSEFSNEILETIKSQIPAQKFEAYFSKGFEVVDIKNLSMMIKVPTNFIKNMLEKHYKEFISESILKALGQEYQIELLSMQESNKTELNIDLESSLAKESNEPKKKASFTLDSYIPSEDEEKHIIQSKEILKQNPAKVLGIIHSKKFENFIVGSSNNMAFATAVAISKQPGVTYPSVYLHGNSGLGKTHLIHAVANKIHELHPEKSIAVTSANAFMAEMIQSIKDNKQFEFRKKYTNSIDVLIIDDIHELKNKEGTQNEFFHIFNELHRKKKQLIFTSDKHPNNITGITERIKTRLSWGLVLEIQRPDFETRIAILKKKALEMDLFLTDDVIELIAKSVQSNIRELEGSLVQLYAYSSIHNIDIDTQIAREYLKLDERSEKIRSVTMEDVSKVICDYYQVTQNDLIGKARLKEIIQARHMAMYLCYEQVKKTQKEIAQFFGGRDHTTVLHAVKKLKEKLKTEPKLIENYNHLIGRLNN